MLAGVVFYRRRGSELIGRWSHSKLGGRLADERVSGVAPRAVTGTWPVEISDPTGEPMFSGELESTRFGECLRLNWRGKLLPAGKPALFEGIGYVIDSDRLCASFEEAQGEPDRGS